MARNNIDSQRIPINVVPQQVSVSVSIPDATFGTIRTRVDSARTLDNTAIASVNGEVFPLNVQIRVYALAEMVSKFARRRR
jgi:hypothetical protein